MKFDLKYNFYKRKLVWKYGLKNGDNFDSVSICALLCGCMGDIRYHCRSLVSPLVMVGKHRPFFKDFSIVVLTYDTPGLPQFRFDEKLILLLRIPISGRCQMFLITRLLCRLGCTNLKRSYSHEYTNCALNFYGNWINLTWKYLYPNGPEFEIWDKLPNTSRGSLLCVIHYVNCLSHGSIVSFGMWYPVTYTWSTFNWLCPVCGVRFAHGFRLFGLDILQSHYVSGS